MADETPQTSPATLPMEVSESDNAVQQLALAQNAKPIWWTNINHKSPEGKALIWKCNGDPDFRLVDYPEVKLSLARWYVSKARKVDEHTGEITDLPRIVLIDTEGKTYECFSPILAKDLAVLISLYPEISESNHQGVIIRKVPLGGGRNMLRMMPDPSAAKQIGKRK